MTQDKDRLRAMMMAALDGELDADGRAQLERELATDAELEKEWASMRELKAVTAGLSYREPPEEVWDDYWDSVYNRFERGVGWVLFGAGAVVVSGWGLWHWFETLLAETQLPPGIRLALVALSLGGLLLVLSVVREKWFTHRHDPYRGVDR